MRRAAAGIVLALMSTLVASRGLEVRASPPTAYQQECADCHMAYPPVLLPASSWQSLMRNLSRHFGTDATVSEPARTQIEDALVAQGAVSGRRAIPPPEDRITRSQWFLRKHRELTADVWQRPAIKSPSRCTACHVQVSQGHFDEHDVRIPR